MASTLLVAVAFRPLRRALQDAVDRRFSRARYEALRRIRAFLDELRAGRAAPDPVATLVEASGLAIEIARLRVELRGHLAEVEASRARFTSWPAAPRCRSRSGQRPSVTPPASRQRPTSSPARA